MYRYNFYCGKILQNMNNDIMLERRTHINFNIKKSGFECVIKSDWV